VLGETWQQTQHIIGAELTSPDHLCKPDLSTANWDGFPRWQASVARLASHPNVYMKLSGALNEFAPAATPSSAGDVLEALKPYLSHVLHNFGAQRLMYGSDWPVCNFLLSLSPPFHAQLCLPWQFGMQHTY
jgi:predicted TIM-barrel fold metal-dependent hydrolase